MDLNIFKQLVLALVLSGFVGIERERKNQISYFSTFGGVRTFSLIGLLGLVSFLLSSFSMLLFLVITAGFMCFIIAIYIVTTIKNDRIGATSELASILVFLIGVLVGMEQYVLATTIALVIVSVLHFKHFLHSWVKKLKNEEIISAIQFVLIAFVVLPILPNYGFGPYGFFNPYIIWLMVVVISGISFVSYVAIKILGSRGGICFTGFLAGFISSTALTLSFSAESKKNKSISVPYVIAVVVASSAMFFRVLLEVAVLNPDLLDLLLIPMSFMGGVGLLIAMYYFFYKSDDKKMKKTTSSEVFKFQSPFNLVPALKFGILFALILFVSKFARDYFGEAGTYLISFVSGIVDVDAITVSMAQDSIPENAAVLAITIAAMTNTLAKGIMFFVFGERKTAIQIVKIFSVMILFGFVSLLFLIY